MQSSQELGWSATIALVALVAVIAILGFSSTASTLNRDQATAAMAAKAAMNRTRAAIACDQTAASAVAGGSGSSQATIGGTMVTGNVASNQLHVSASVRKAQFPLQIPLTTGCTGQQTIDTGEHE